MHWCSVDRLMMPVAEATLPITDRGLMFGDGVFETLRVTRGLLPHWHHHWQRLESGLRSLKFPATHLPEEDQLKHDCRELIKKNNCEDGLLRLAITRGSGSLGYLPTHTGKSRHLITMRALPIAPKSPISLMQSSYCRPPQPAFPAGVKALSSINLVLAKMEAHEHQCFDAIMLNSRGFVSECSSGNFFWIKDHIIHTPALTSDCLPGITRKLVIEAASQLKIPLHEGNYPIEHVHAADAAFYTNTGFGILPVKQLHKKCFTEHAIISSLSEYYLNLLI